MVVRLLAQGPDFSESSVLYFAVNTFGPKGKRPLGRPRRRWEDNIKADLQEIG
jgi:hypothetical protein